MKKLRIGFIGSGGMADAHLKGLAYLSETGEVDSRGMANAHLKGLASENQFPDVQLVAFCDIALERAQAQCDKYPAHAPTAYASPQTMIAEAGLDACYVLVPPFAHGDAERACIEGKVPFLTEKPIGLDLGVLRELRDEVQQQNLLAAAGYMNRYQPSVKRAKAAMSDDELVLAYGWWLSGPPLQPKDGKGSFLMQWWADKARSGGQFHEQVTHSVDLARYFLGDAVEVFAHATTSFNHKLPNLVEGYNIDDALIANVKFKSGAIASLMASVATPVGGQVTLDIYGTKSTVKFSGWGHDATILRKGEEPEIVKSAGEIFAIEDRAFLDAVQTGDASKILAPYVDSFKTAQITVAANQSAASGKPVEID